MPLASSECATLDAGLCGSGSCAAPTSGAGHLVAWIVYLHWLNLAIVNAKEEMMLIQMSLAAFAVKEPSGAWR